MVEILAQSFVSGIFIGALYGLAAVGLSLVFGVMRILNVAHGDLIMLGAYASFWFLTLFKIDPFLGLPLTAIVLFLFGAVLYRVLFSPIIKFPEELKIKSSLLITFALALILPQIAVLWWTGNERFIMTPYTGLAFEILGVRVSYIGLGSAALALVVIMGLHLFLRKTYFGKSIRATAEDWEAASLMGVNIGRTYLISFALGAALAGIAGTLVGVTYAIAPAIGLAWTIKALIVIVLAGMGSIGGAIVAGLLLGVVESVSAIWIGPYMYLIGLAMFLLVLMFRPQGLFGRR